MTDKLRAAAKMALEALRNAYDASLNGNSKGCQWIVHEQITALRQALDQLPDTTKMIDTGIDRGAWDDVPDATKWVDELRGEEWTPEDMAYRPSGLSLEESPNSTTNFVEPVAWVLLDLWKTGQHWPDDCFNFEGGEGMTPLYTTPIKHKGGQYAKECEAEVQRLKELIDELENDDPPPKREWQGLTYSELQEISDSMLTWNSHDIMDTYVAIEAKLREKNT